MDGLLESYPWRGPLSLDFKPFTLQLQGTVPQLLLRLCSNNCVFVLVIKPPDVLFFRELRVADRQREESPPSLLSFIPSPVLRTLLPGRRPPHPCSPSLGKASTTSPTSPLPSRAFSSLGADRLRGLPPLAPLTDLPLLSALHAKKPPHCRDPCLHGSPGSSPCLFPLHGPLSPQGPSLLPHLSDTAGPYCLYRYSFPLNPQLTAISRHAKLAEDTTDCLLRQSPWHPTTNHCL